MFSKYCWPKIVCTVPHWEVRKSLDPDSVQGHMVCFWLKPNRRNIADRPTLLCRAPCAGAGGEGACAGHSGNNSVNGRATVTTKGRSTSHVATPQWPKAPRGRVVLWRACVTSHPGARRFRRSKWDEGKISYVATKAKYFQNASRLPVYTRGEKDSGLKKCESM